MTNPYQTPKTNIELPPEPDTPKLISWAYMLVGINWLFAQLDTLLLFFTDSAFIDNFWALGGLTILNIVIAWWIYQGIKQRNRLSWGLPGLLLLLTIVSFIMEMKQVNGFELLVYAGNILTFIALLAILFLPAGKAWRNGDVDDGMLS